MFTCLDHVSASHAMISEPNHIKVLVLEHCVEAALSDIRECSASTVVRSASFAQATENAAELVKIIHHFLSVTAVNDISLWTENVSALRGFFCRL